MKTEKILKAGEIAKQAKQFARTIIKKGIPLLEIADKIESKIIELGGKPAFPVNLSIDNVAAHYTPSYNDESIAQGLLKVDLGVHIKGHLADTAFSLDLENSEQNKKLIEASKKALEKAQATIKSGVQANEIGKVIEKTIESHGFSPIINLSGHEMKSYELHAGITIPNIEDTKEVILKKGLYAIEPFATTGSGKVHDGKPSGIYILQDEKAPRSLLAREILNYIIEEYKTLPFCSRWLVKQFTTKALFALRELEINGNLYNFPQLVEISDAIVSQAENTILVEDKITITTE